MNRMYLNIIDSVSEWVLRLSDSFYHLYCVDSELAPCYIMGQGLFVQWLYSCVRTLVGPQAFAVVHCVCFTIVLSVYYT